MLVKLEAYYDEKFWCARGIGASVFTQGKTFEELLENVKEAVALHFKEKLEEGEPLQILTGKYRLITVTDSRHRLIGKQDKPFARRG
jgi:hypothetical protein